MVIQFITKKEKRIQDLERKVENLVGKNELLQGMLNTTLKSVYERLEKLEANQSSKELTPEQVKVLKEEQEKTNLYMQNILSQYLYGATQENGGKPIK
jgi:predicted nuclease with TOPRIM domain